MCVLLGHLRHAYKIASSLNRHRGVEAITALAIQHNGLLSPHHQSLSQPTPPTHTLENNTPIQIHTRVLKQIHMHIHTHILGLTQSDRSLIMPLFLSDMACTMADSPRPCVKAPTHSSIHLLFYLSSYLLSHPSIALFGQIPTQLLPFFLS